MRLKRTFVSIFLHVNINNRRLSIECVLAFRRFEARLGSPLSSPRTTRRPSARCAPSPRQRRLPCFYPPLVRLDRHYALDSRACERDRARSRNLECFTSGASFAGD